MKKKFWEVLRVDLHPFNGSKLGHTALMRSANKQKVDEFVKTWEAKWQENKKNNCSEIGHSWVDCEDKLIVNQLFLDDC